MVKSLRLLIFCITLGSPFWWWKCTPPTCLLLSPKGKKRVNPQPPYGLKGEPKAFPPLLILTQLCGEEALLLLDLEVTLEFIGLRMFEPPPQ